MSAFPGLVQNDARASEGHNPQHMPHALVPLEPPPVEPSAALRWLFLRCFADADAPSPGRVDGAEVARLATCLDLVTRLASRHELQRLAHELGRAPALALFAGHAREAARARARADLGERAAAIAHESALPLVWLKASALVRAGFVAAHARPAGDVDVLVSSARAQEFAATLCARGLRVCEVPAEAHQLKPLTDGQGGVLEIHTHLPGLRDPADGAALTYEALVRQGALDPLAHPAQTYVPRRDVLLAHAVAHALVQNACAPHVACPTRLLADVLDLAVVDDEACCARASTWLADLLVPQALDDVRVLARRLAGADAALWDELARGDDAGPVRLLRHALAGALVPGYRARLRARAALGARGTRWHAWRRALLLDDAQVVALYGRPRGRAGYWVRRLGRPFDLALRLLRARAAGVLGSASRQRGAPRRSGSARHAGVER